MLAPENSVDPMCDLEGRPKIKRMTLFRVIWSFFLSRHVVPVYHIAYHNQNGTEPELRSKASCFFVQIFSVLLQKLNFVIALADNLAYN